MLLASLLVMTTILVAYANGSNDNFKGVATLYACNTLSYRGAITLATIATFAGSVASVFIAAGLIKVFSGHGVVPDQVAQSTAFLASIASGAAGTVLIATITGFPISTTHALTGAIIGAGLAAVGPSINVTILGSSFFAPLLFSPLISILLTAILFALLKWLTVKFDFTGGSYFCLGAAQTAPLPSIENGAALAFSQYPDAGPSFAIERAGSSFVASRGQLLILPMRQMRDFAHCASAAAVSFARGLNDTPKMIALLVVLQMYDSRLGVAVIATAIAVGGLISARKVAHTLSKKICSMEDDQALLANFVTAMLVIVASRFGMPVSTTHVSVGAISGIGMANRTVDKKMLLSIVMSWIITLPVAALIGAISYELFVYMK